jgi:hypothetical protein
VPIRTGESFATFILPASADQYDVRFPQQHRLPIASIEEMLFIDQAEITVRENHDIEKWDWDPPVNGHTVAVVCNLMIAGKIANRSSYQCSRQQQVDHSSADAKLRKMQQ